MFIVVMVAMTRIVATFGITSVAATGVKTGILAARAMQDTLTSSVLLRAPRIQHGWTALGTHAMPTK